ncbi:MAG: PAS domain S-box protein [Proteobacteria bacterium]|nr:PAS domain S-box protein [Pseudomonadota bacterium]MBU1716019.1 PAS domain S-box protein [Pseudomonadota bacterium]
MADPDQTKIKGLSIFNRLFLAFTATSLLVISIMGAVYYFYAKERVNELVNDQTISTMHEAVSYFERGYSATITGDLNLLESIPSLNNFLTVSRDEAALVRFDIEKLFFKLANSHDNLYQSVIFFDAYGHEKIVVRNKKRVRALSSIAQYLPDDLVQQGMARLYNRLKTSSPGTILFEGPFGETGGGQTFVVGITKREPEIAGFGGVIMFHCDLSDFMIYLSEVRILDRQVAWLFAADGRTVFAPAERDFSETPGSCLHRGRSLGNEDVVVNDQGLVASHCKGCTLGSGDHGFVEIVFSIPPDIYSNIMQGVVVRVIWVTIFLLIIAGVISFVLARQFARPIIELANSSAQLSKGDFSVEFKVETGGEIGVLARSLNKMTMELHELIASRDREILFRLRSEKALKKSEEMYREVVEGTEDFITQVDRDGKFIYLNHVAVKIIGLNQEELVGELSFDFVHPEDRNRTREWFRTCVDRQIDKSSIENRQVNRENGKVFHLLWASNFHYDERGGLERVDGISHDITRRIEAEAERERLMAQLRQSQKMESVGTLAGGIAHDFNNILAALLGFTELAMLEAPVGSALANDLQEIFKAGNRAKNLVKQILSFSRQASHEKQPLAAHLIIKEAFKLLRATIPSTIEMRQDIDPGCGQIFADPTQIHQVLMNLCTNAAQAMDEKGGVLGVLMDKVLIAPDDDRLKGTECEPGIYLRLCVDDDGPGVDPLIMDRIFEPYFTSKEVGKGSGLGLSVVHGIVKNHQGFVTVANKPDGGAKFCVFFPMLAELVEPITEERGPVPGGNETVLVVDDEEVVVSMAEQLLEKLGYQVVTKISSLEALAEFTTNPARFDLVITDQTMPGLTGEQLAVKLIEIRPNLPIIMCTGYSARIDEKKAADLGIKAFVMKPYEKREIALVIRQVLDR